MEQHLSPMVFLYRKSAQKWTPIVDQYNLFQEIGEEISEFLQTIHLNEPSSSPLYVNDHLYNCIWFPLGQDEYVFIFQPEEYSLSIINREMEGLIREQQQQLFSFIQNGLFSKEKVMERLYQLKTALHRIVPSDNIRVWMWNQDCTTLSCETVLNSGDDQKEANATIKKVQMPQLFRKIEKERYLHIPDIDMYEGKDEFFQGNYPGIEHIQSLLVVPILFYSGIAGMLCMEAYEKRTWSGFEQMWAGVFADMMGVLLEHNNRIYTEEKILHQAYHDPLTGLLNYHTFVDMVDQQLVDMDNPQKAFIIYLELDQFSQIQDALGYTSGNAVLQITANRLKAFVQNKGLVARVGFGHFVMYLEGKKMDKPIEAVMETISKELLLPMYVFGQDVYVTHSYGVSTFPDHARTAHKCIQFAQLALNNGKKHHSRSVQVYFTKEMACDVREDLLVEMNLRKGLDLNEFELYYQPQIDAFSGKLSGLEGLIRWNHPEKGLISPGEFIDLAESTGLILPIGEWVISEACKQLEQWHMNGIHHLTISVNISPRHFLHPSIVPYLQSCIKKYRFNPEQLIIEITENVAINDFQAVKERIIEIRSLGFIVSIDDFGTGFSAFQYLQHFPVNEIKIDRQFIRDITSNQVSQGIAKTIIELARLLNLNVVSEGVETKEQWDLLKKFGCPIVQGYYFSKPKPIHELRAWFSREEGV